MNRQKLSIRNSGLFLTASLMASMALAGCDSGPPHIDTVLSQATFTCTDCWRHEYDLSLHARDQIRDGFDQVINGLGSDLKVQAQTVSFEFKADRHLYQYDQGHLALGINRAVLTDEAWPWLVQQAMVVAVQAWSIERLQGPEYDRWVMPLAEAVSTLAIFGQEAVCPYFSGVVVGQNLVVKRLCDAELMNSHRLWSLAQDITEQTAGPDQRLSIAEYLGLWSKHFGQDMAAGIFLAYGLHLP